MRARPLTVLAALAAAISPTYSQSTIPPQIGVVVGMPSRDWAPGALVFYADPYSTPVNQPLWVNPMENGSYVPVALSLDPDCQSWLFLASPYEFPTTLQAHANAPGTYTCRVTILRNGKPIGSIPIYLNVGPGTAGTTPNVAAPNTLTFPPLDPDKGEPQVISVNSSAYSATIIPVEATNDVHYFDPLVTIAASDGKITVRSTSSGITPSNKAQVYVETPAGMEVVRVAIANGALPGLIARPASINLKAAGGAPVADTAFTVEKVGTGSLPLTVTSSASWVKVTPPANAVTPATYSLSFDTSYLPNGFQTAEISIRATGTGYPPVIVPVVLLVSGSSVPAGALSINPSSLAFQATAGGAQPAAQTIGVTAASATSFTTTVSTQSGGSWLRVSPPGTLNTSSTSMLYAGVDTTGLSAGVYNGSVTFSVPGTAFSRAIPVTLKIDGAAAPPPVTLSAVPPSLSFSYRLGDPPPQPATLQVAGTAGLAFTAQATSDGGWLAVSPASGSVSPATSLAVTVDTKAAGLAPGPHQGSVTLSASGGPSVTVPATLTVTAPVPAISRVVNAASYEAGAIAAGEIITIFGERLGPAEGQGLALAADGRVSTSAGGVQVLVGGFAAPILYASERQVSAIVPYEIAAPFLATPDIVVTYGGQRSDRYATTQVNAAPALFTADSSGTGRAAALDADYSANSPSNAVAAGGVIQLFVTGEGQTSPAGVTGKITTVAAEGPLTPQALPEVTVTIDGLPAKVLFYGEAPGIVSGMMQINAEIPPGAQAGEDAVSVTLGSGANAHSTQSGVTVSVK